MSERESLFAFRKGDKVVVVLRGAGVETREDSEVIRVSKGLVFTADSDYPYDQDGRWTGPDFGGFSRRIEEQRCALEGCEGLDLQDGMCPNGYGATCEALTAEWRPT